MCVAYPGRVETIEGAHGIVNFSGNKVRVNLSMVSVETGDYVLVHAGMAIQKVEKKEALETRLTDIAEAEQRLRSIG